jgi:hypothetical protein
MSKRSVFTTVTALPAGVTRQIVMETLHNHAEMIDLNPLVEERHPIKPPADATPEEFHCLWYSLTDRISYLPGGHISGKVSYNACLHDLENGLQTHAYAPLGLNIKTKWTLGGSLPGEPAAPVELGIGAPLSGLYLRQDIDMKCNIMVTSFVKKSLKAAPARLLHLLVTKSQFAGPATNIEHVSQLSPDSRTHFSDSNESAPYSPSVYDDGYDNGEVGSDFWNGGAERNYSDYNNQFDAAQVPAPLNLSFRRPADPNVRNTNEAASSAPTLTVQGPCHSRSYSEHRSQPLYPESDAAALHNHRASYNGPYTEQQPQPPYPDSALGSPGSHRASWQSSPPIRSPAIQEMDASFGQAPPYQANSNTFYAELPANEELPANGERREAGRSERRSYVEAPRVYGAAELA